VRFFTLFIASALIACSTTPTTRVVAAWKDPNVDVVNMGRPLVVFQHKSETLRRTVEDAIVERIPNATQAYRMFSTNDVFKVEDVRERVREAGFDTVIILHLVDVEQQVTWSPGVPSRMYGPLWPYWGYGWTTVYDPGYLDRTTVVTLETLVYSLDIGDGELIWASRSETFDPRSVDDLAQSVVAASTRAMEREGLFVAR
jgi:hypothetical protein